MRIDHRRFHAGVPRQFLDRADVCPRFQKVRGEGVPQRVTGDPLGEFRPPCGYGQSAGHVRFVVVVSASDAGAWIGRNVGLRKHVLPEPTLRRMR